MKSGSAHWDLALADEVRQRALGSGSPAGGWIILNRAGLSAEQRAVALARSLGSLKRDDIGKALRSCYPEFTVPKKKVFGAAAVSDGMTGQEDIRDDDEESDFADAEKFLADHAGADNDDDDEASDESEVREILAATWQKRRKSLSKLQKARRFHEAGQTRRSFRVEVEELKKRTRCHRCRQVGHWSRECKNPAVKGSGKGGSKNSASKSDSGAAMVEHFVASVSHGSTMLQQLRARSSSSPSVISDSCVEHEQLLVSSPGSGVLDSGCGKTIIGEDTLREFQELWKSHGFVQPEFQPEVNHFRFGNGSRETTTHAVSMPLILAGRRGSIRVVVVKGSAPLLISRGAMHSLKAQIDFGSSELRVFDEGHVIPLRTNAAGQYVVYLLGQRDVGEAVFSEVMQAEATPQSLISDLPKASNVESVEPAVESCVEDASANSSSPEVHTSGPDVTAVWSRVDKGVTFVPITGKQSPYWHQIIHRKVIDLDTQEVDHNLPKKHYFVPMPSHVKHTLTEFVFRPQEKICPTECLPVHQIRQVAAELQTEHKLDQFHSRPISPTRPFRSLDLLRPLVLSVHIPRKTSHFSW
eukprot:s282_g32.t1